MRILIERRRKTKTPPRVGPRSPRALSDIVWPVRHGKWWNWDAGKGRTKTVEELYQGFRIESVEQAQDALEHVEEITQTAVDRAAAADRRATTIAGTVAIAASLTIGGAGIVIDPSKITDSTIRGIFAAVLCVVTVAFILSAIFALRALVVTRTWNWSDPFEMPPDSTDRREEKIGMRAASRLSAFAFNWEISDLKNRCVDRALQLLLVALVGIAGLSALVVVYVL
jgi:hypothetical protein